MNEPRLRVLSQDEPTPSEITSVDPGQIIVVRMLFDGDPARVRFSHLAPGELAAEHDPGFGELGSKIERLSEGDYRVAIDTRGMNGGLGWWHFQSEDDDRPLALQRAKLGKFEVRQAPSALFDRNESSLEALIGADGVRYEIVSGLFLLAAA